MQDTGMRTLIAGAAMIALLGAAPLGTSRPGGTASGGGCTAPSASAADNEPAVQLAERVTPSVVTVYAERAVSRPVLVMTDLEETGARNSAEAREGWVWRSGSGFAVAAGGYVVTNYHVVSDARQIEARLSDGRRVGAQLVGSDPMTDLALLRIEASLEPLAWGDDVVLRAGSPVIAVGSPLDFHLSVSAGIVGGFGRAYDGADPVSYIQHDAALNPGSSGGPLIDRTGRVVGVNTAIPQEAFFPVGISLAIPAGIASEVTGALLRNGRVERGYLGLTVRALHGSLASAMRRENGDGVLIEAVDPASPAAQAGLRAGQTLLAINGIELSAPRDLARALLLTRPGDQVALSVHDGQARVRVEAVLDLRPHIQAGPAAADADDRSGLRRGYGLSFAAAEGAGVLVIDVVPGGPAAQAGLRDGDRVLAVGAEDLSDPEEAALRLTLARRDVALRVLRGGETAPRYIALALDTAGAGRAPDHTGFVDASGGPF